MTNSNDFRIEHDSMGELKVPKDALYGAQTQRAIDNFHISNLTMPVNFIKSLAFIKAACAKANCNLNLLNKDQTDAITKVALAITNNHYLEAFPLDVFQTGSGTSTNMNMNEVIATIANKTSSNIHPNDHVNMSQSSNDTIPTAIAVSASLAIHNQLLPNLEHLEKTIFNKAEK